MKIKGIQSEMKSYEDRIKSVDKDIENVGGESIQKRRREVKAAKDRHSTLQKEISSTKVKLRSADKAIKQLEEENGRLLKDVQDAEQAIQTSKTQFEIIEKEAVKVLAAFEQAQATQKAKEEEKNAAATSFEELKNQNTETEKALGEVEEKSAGLAKQLEELSNQRDIWIKKIDTLRKRTWENTRELDGDEEIAGSSTSSPLPSPDAMEVEEENGEDQGDMEVETEPTEAQQTAQRSAQDPGYRIIPDVPEERLASLDKARIERNIIRLEAEKDNLKKNVNLSAIAEYVE